MRRSATAGPGLPPAVTASQPSMARRRWAAVSAALALPVSMLAPWYSLRVSAPGPSGRHAFTQQFTGWEELSTAAIVCVLVAVGVCVLVAVRVAVPITGLGAEGRRTARARVDGALIAVCGLLCIAMLLWTMVAPPAVASSGMTVITHTGVRWGVLLTLAPAGTLAACGLQIAAAAGRSLRDRRAGGRADSRGPVPPVPGPSASENGAPSSPTLSMRRRPGSSPEHDPIFDGRP